jgi:hypothetical protein
MKENLREPGHNQRVDEAEQNGSNDGIEHGGDEVATHRRSFRTIL